MLFNGIDCKAKNARAVADHFDKVRPANVWRRYQGNTTGEQGFHRTAKGGISNIRTKKFVKTERQFLLQAIGIISSGSLWPL